MRLREKKARGGLHMSKKNSKFADVLESNDQRQTTYPVHVQTYSHTDTLWTLIRFHPRGGLVACHRGEGGQDDNLSPTDGADG